ncbi:MAG: hypothetical protein ACRD0Q_05125 [Acidimicrobiales bacterium]
MQRHDLDLVSLTAGVTFAGLGAAFLLDLTSGLTLQLRWVWPLLLIAIGVAVLLGSRPR